MVAKTGESGFRPPLSTGFTKIPLTELRDFPSGFALFVRKEAFGGSWLELYVILQLVVAFLFWDSITNSM